MSRYGTSGIFGHRVILVKLTPVLRSQWRIRLQSRAVQRAAVRSEIDLVVVKHAGCSAISDLVMVMRAYCSAIYDLALRDGTVSSSFSLQNLQLFWLQPHSTSESIKMQNYP